MGLTKKIGIALTALAMSLPIPTHGENLINKIFGPTSVEYNLTHGKSRINSGYDNYSHSLGIGTLPEVLAKTEKFEWMVQKV